MKFYLLAIIGIFMSIQLLANDRQTQEQIKSTHKKN